MPSSAAMWARLRRALVPYLAVLSHDRGEIGFLIWPILWMAVLTARGLPSGWAIPIVVLAALMVFWAARLAAHSRSSDDASRLAGVPQSRARWVAGILAVLSVVMVFVVGEVAGYLAFAGVMAAVLIPVVQARSWLVQVHVGVVLTWGVPVTSAALSAALPNALAWLLWLTSVLWATSGVLWRAMATREEDARAERQTTARLLGEAGVIAQGLLLACTVLALLMLGARAELGLAWWVAVAIAVLIGAVALWRARSREARACLHAWKLTFWQGAILFMGLLANFWMDSGA